MLMGLKPPDRCKVRRSFGRTEASLHEAWLRVPAGITDGIYLGARLQNSKYQIAGSAPMIMVPVVTPMFFVSVTVPVVVPISAPPFPNDATARQKQAGQSQQSEKHFHNKSSVKQTVPRGFPGSDGAKPGFVNGLNVNLE